MAKIRIDEGELLMALDSGDGTMQWYLDRQTGEVIGLDDAFDSWFDDEELDDDDEDEDEDGDKDADKVEAGEEAGWEDQERALRRKIHADVNDERYLQIPSLGSSDGFRIMERFAALQDGRVREALFDALDRRRPFRSFKDALTRFPEVRERWFAYHEERLREEALAWLRVEGIDAELVSPAVEPEG